MKKTTQRILLFLLFSFTAAFAMAQQRKTFTGTVRDEGGNPLSGITVQVKGTKTFGVTDANGTFTISTTTANPKLIFTGVGLSPVELDADEGMSITMKAKAGELQEVVVTGFGAKKSTRNLVYAVQEVKGAEVARAGSVNIGGIHWTYATGLTGPAGLGSGPSGYTLVLHAAADTGLTAAPSFETWMNGFNWSGFTNPDLSFGGDPDGDGISSGVENYFGTAPNSFSQGLVAGERNGNQFTFTHPLNANPAGGLTPRYRWSADLLAFHDDGSPNGGGTTTVTFADPVPAGDVVSVTATVTGSIVPDRVFARVEVTQE